MSQLSNFSLGTGSTDVQTLTGNTGGAVGPTAGNINVVGSGNITIAGNPGTSTLTATVVGTTNHAVQIGNASGSLTSIGVGTTGQVLTGVTGGDPVFASPAASSITITGDTGGGLTGNSFTFTGGATGLTFNGAVSTETLSGTLVVAHGGTGATTLTNHGVVIGQGTSAVHITTAGTNGQLLIGGNSADPAFASLTSTGGTIVYTPGLNTLNLETSGATANSFVTGSGTATPSAGVLTVPNGSNINTTGSGSTLTINLVNSPSVSGSVTAGTGLVATTGGVTATAGNIVASAGNINATVGSMSAGTTVTAGTGVTATTGNITASSGNVVVTAGNVTLPNTNGAGTQGEITFGGNRFVTNAGTLNTFVGQSSGTTNNTGASNTGLGASALGSLTSGNNNTAVGDHALGAKTSNDFNVALGASALSSLTTGDNNIAIGYSSGSNYTSTETSNIVIGNLGTALEGNTIRIGTSGSAGGQQNRCFIAGIDGVNVGSTAQVVTEVSGQLGSAVITAGTNISVTPGANTITIAATGSASFSWSVVTGATQSMAVNHGYIANNGGTCVMTLPATAAVGDILEVTGINNATGWQIAQNSGQTVHFGSSNTTTGATGSLTSTATRDSVRLVCVVANTDFNVLSSIGNITVA